MPHKLGVEGLGPQMLGCIQQRLALADFTDGGGASGYKDLAKTLPIGALVIGWGVRVIEAFQCGTSGLVSVGTTGNVDAYTGLATDPVDCNTVGETGGCTALSDGTDGTNQALEAAGTVRVNIVDGGGDWATPVAAGTGEIDFIARHAVVPMNNAPGTTPYTWQSEPLTDGQVYRFVVRIVHARGPTALNCKLSMCVPPLPALTGAWLPP